MTELAPKSSFVVYSTGGKFEVLPPSAKAIFGEYIEDGENHGRKTYRRHRSSAQICLPEVILFFWDSRDGADLAGWWFGDQIGAGNVWSRNAQMTATPPMKGWRCPVDGPEQKHVMCVPKVRPRTELVEVAAGLQLSNGAPAKQPHAKLQTMVFSSRLDDEAVQALAGEYVEEGTNHGCKTFFKKSENGSDASWLYYWDQRDGWAYAGWWLGDRVGGAQVYGHAPQHSSMPPPKGWRIPSDGPATNDVSITLKGHEEEVDMPQEDRLKNGKALVDAVEEKAEKSIETAQTMLGGSELLEEGVRAVYELLQSQVVILDDAMSALSRHAKAGEKHNNLSEETAGELSLLEERLQAVSGRVAKEATNAKQRLDALELEVAEQRNSKAIEETLPLAMEAVVRAEQAMESAGTDEEATRATTLIARAKDCVAAALVAAHGYAPEAQKLALTEFNALQFRCELAEKRVAIWDRTARSGALSESIDADGPLVNELETLGEEAGHAEFKDASLGDIVELDPSLLENEMLKQSAGRVTDIEAGAKEAIDTAQLVLKDHVDEKGSKLLLDLLLEHYVHVRRAQKFISLQLETARKTSVTPMTLDVMRTLGPRLKAVRSHVAQELGRATRQVARQQKPEGRGAEGSLSTAQDGVAQAELAVAAVAFDVSESQWYGMQDFIDEDVEEIKRAMDETQAATEKAQDAILSARRHLDGQIRAARMLPDDHKKVAFADIAPLRKRLIEAQKGLNPCKRSLLDVEQKIKAKTFLEDVSRKVATTEAQVARTTRVLMGPSPSTDEVQSEEASLQLALTSLAEAMLALEQNAHCATAKVNNRVAGMQERGKDLQRKIEDLKVKIREQKQHLALRSLVEEAEAETKKAEEWLDRIEKAEEPWLGSHEVVPENVANPALEACNAIAVAAEPTIMASKTVVMEKLVDIRHIAEGTPRLQAAEELMRLQARLDDLALRVTQLKIDTFARRTMLLMPEVIERVVAAEANVKKVTDAAASLSADNVETIEDTELRDVCKKTLACEKGAAKACADARTILAAKQEDPRFNESPSFRSQLLKLVGRLDAAEKELQAQRAAASAAKDSKATLKEFTDNLSSIQSAVSELELLALPLGDERPSNEGDESVAQRVRSSQETLNTWSKVVEPLVSNAPHVSLRFAMSRLWERSRKVQGRLAEAQRMTQEKAKSHKRIAPQHGGDEIPTKIARITSLSDLPSFPK